MPSSIECKRGDVVFVRVRFSDDSGTKRRPAIVVSVDAVHVSRADALIVPLTTQLSVQRFGDHLLRDWESVGLPRASLAKGVVETVDRGTFERLLGRLSEHDLAKVDENLRQILGV